MAFWGHLWCYIMVFQYFGTDIAPSELVFAPIDSWDSGLSIGAKTSSDRLVDLELWRHKIFLQKMCQKNAIFFWRRRRRFSMVDNFSAPSEPSELLFARIRS